MDIELVDLRPGDGGSLQPILFDDTAGFNPDWWPRRSLRSPHPWFVQAFVGGDEVARVQLEEKVWLEAYTGNDQLNDSALKIQLLEVSQPVRRRGIGVSVVEALAERHPHRRLVAFSENADPFWSSLGWERYNHLSKKGCQPLFIQPARS
ncbi:GNAT family N-acetyltransferase [Nocardia sp. NPDC087230]|uniref:GNAT family N-acetyltransferase n=1 Tax=Nocardia sp. NPDC087230 TaxID=3364331 RepID=UPI0037FE6B1C